MLDKLYNFKQQHDQCGVMLCFSGYLSQELMIGIGEVLRNKLKQEEDSSMVLKIFSVFVEQAQNIMRYSADQIPPNSEEDSALGSGILVIGKNQGHYYISCGNIVDNHKVPHLNSQLIKLQQMDKEELKQYYKEQRKKDTPQDSKGAGLGFIELARKSNSQFEFSFQPIDEHFAFFSFKTIL
ncbi:MAG: hypothetical protein RIT27_1982 [Pseudomonadota bacterium]|jgi:hypothetical protein